MTVIGTRQRQVFWAAVAVEPAPRSAGSAILIWVLNAHPCLDHITNETGTMSRIALKLAWTFLFDGLTLSD